MNKYRLNEDTEAWDRRAAREKLVEVERDTDRQEWAVSKAGEGKGYVASWWDRTSPYGWLCSRGYVESVAKAVGYARAELREVKLRNHRVIWG